MAERAQSFESHKRWLPLWHFFVIPVLLINVILVALRASQNPTRWAAWDLLVALAVFFGIFLSRLMPLIAQNRIIRMEEKTRMARLLPAELRGKEEGLSVGQYVALRFAADDEVPELVRRIHSGELKTSGDVKRAIKNWRADHLRV